MVKDRSPPANKSANAEACWALHKWVPNVCLACKQCIPNMPQPELQAMGTEVLCVPVALLEGEDKEGEGMGIPLCKL